MNFRKKRRTLYPLNSGTESEWKLYPRFLM
jgi:hypothetical protein